jgi:hypothetical protein
MLFDGVGQAREIGDMIPVHGNSNWSAVTISVAGPEDLAQGRKRLREMAIVGSKGSKNMPQGLKLEVILRRLRPGLSRALLQSGRECCGRIFFAAFKARRWFCGVCGHD